jgi:adenosine deaminase
LNATLNTDDPSISQIVLSNEYRLANEDLGVPLSVLRDQSLASAQAAFLPDGERAELVHGLEEEYRVSIPRL